MFEIGATLREAREKRGLSPADVHRELRIRERYLTALEEERWELLPGEAYTKGFLRGYAEFLGLNGTLYVDEFNARVAEHDEEPFVPDTFARDGRRTSRILFRTIAGVIVVGGAVAAASALVHGGSPASTLPPPARARTAAPHHIAGVPAAPKPRTPTARVRLLGRSWFSIRLGGPNGREVFRGFLTRGEHRTYVLSNAVWIRIGRPSAVAITIGTRTIRRAGDRPVNLLLTKAGARAA
ncbi:MAG TPA: RodZ domain-containing protein [Gaiellaceae bacterium]|nr:RodZ domain-containing protein [Gaiellaceae bacterium]